MDDLKLWNRLVPWMRRLAPARLSRLDSSLNRFWAAWEVERATR